MPVVLELKLRGRAAAKGYRGKRYRKYVYGGLRRSGWRPSRERRPGHS